MKLLENVTTSRSSRNAAAEFISENPQHFEELAECVFNTGHQFHVAACMVFELIVDRRLGLLIPISNKFCELLAAVRHDTAKRSIARICMLSAKLNNKEGKRGRTFFSAEQISIITEACFNWLISDEKVAVKAYAMRTLAQTGKTLDWVYPAMQPILEQHYSEGSPAYRSAAKDVLREIAKVYRPDLPKL